MKKHNGFTAIEVLIVLFILTVISFCGWYILDKKKNNDKQGTNTNEKIIAAKFEEEPINTILNDIVVEPIDKIGACLAINKDCSVSYILKLKQPAVEDFIRLVENIEKANWLDSENNVFSLNLEELRQNTEENDITPYNMITLGLFGEDDYIQKNNVKMRIYAFDGSQIQTNDYPYYIYESEVDGDYNWENLLTNLEDNKYYLNISLRQE